MRRDVKLSKNIISIDPFFIWCNLCKTLSPFLVFANNTWSLNTCISIDTGKIWMITSKIMTSVKQVYFVSGYYLVKCHLIFSICHADTFLVLMNNEFKKHATIKCKKHATIKYEKSRNSWNISVQPCQNVLPEVQQRRSKCVVNNTFSLGHNHLVNSNCFLLSMQGLNIISLFFYMYQNKSKIAFTTKTIKFDFLRKGPCLKGQILNSCVSSAFDLF